MSGVLWFSFALSKGKLPLTPPSNAGQAGFKRLLFERSEFAGAPAWPSRAGQVRAANPSRRAPFFWLLFFGVKKSNSPQRRSRGRNALKEYTNMHDQIKTS